MSTEDPKLVLHRYLQMAREAVLWKLDGLSERQARTPMVPTGTNLLGLVKHLAGVEYGYLGLVLGRPPSEPMPWWADDAEPNADMWATPDESKESVVALYRRACTHADQSIEQMPLDAVGRVPWWRADRNQPTLHALLVHVIAETNRHAGHADIVRELTDGAVGLRVENTNMPSTDPAWWDVYRGHLQDVADRFA